MTQTHPTEEHTPKPDYTGPSYRVGLALSLVRECDSLCEAGQFGAACYSLSNAWYYVGTVSARLSPGSYERVQRALLRAQDRWARALHSRMGA